MEDFSKAAGAVAVEIITAAVVLIAARFITNRFERKFYKNLSN